MATVPEITVGIDIGTSSVKAIAADADGNVVARARTPHEFYVPSPLRFEHDARDAWFDGPRRALEALGDIEPRGVCVAAMVPSLTAVDAAGVPCTPGLLYGDERGHGEQTEGIVEAGEIVRFLRWTAKECPDARGFWPAQGVANFAISGEPVVSTTVAATALPLFDWTGWDSALAESCGASIDQLPRIAVSGQPAGAVTRYRDAVLEGGTIDAFGEQMVAGADSTGDVLVICGTTLIVWAVLSEPAESRSYYTVPHTTPDKFLLGGPSNAGGLFLNWATRMLADAGPPATPDAIPLWVPYPRGERVPLQDNARRAQIVDLDLTHGPAAVRRAAYEAAGFVTRRMIDASPEPAQRIVATGGGTRVDEWLRALADCTGLPVHVTAIAEGGALGAAFLARVAAGLEEGTAAASRWARTSRIVEPDPVWERHAAERYSRFLEVAS